LKRKPTYELDFTLLLKEKKASVLKVKISIAIKSYV